MEDWSGIVAGGLIARHPRTQAPKAAGGGFIAELHGVRGIALALVVLFHVFGQGRVSGGVDVFLFFSGFLLTASMYRRSIAGSRGRVLRHYARTLLRLVPAALVVLIAVSAAVLLIRPLSAQVQDFREVRASLLYYENLELIASQLSYGAAGPDASPLQHFWSLSVQGQFFLGWPLIVVAFVALGKLLGRPLLFTTAAVAAVTLAGFVFAQSLVLTDQPVAYFDGLSRWWELTAGGLLGLILMRWRLPASARSLPGWLGLGIIVAAGFIVDGASTFPGPWVLLPLSGAALVLLGAGGPHGPQGLLATRPLTWLADIAYELYLWHWPILVFFLVWQGKDSVSLLEGSLVVVVSMAAAALTHGVLVRPISSLGRVDPRDVVFGAIALLAVGAIVVTVLIDRAEAGIERATKAPTSVSDHPGAEVVRNPQRFQTDYSVPEVPPLDVARLDFEDAMGRGCWQDWRRAASPIEWCKGPENEAGPQVALVGGSRALMWQPMLQEVAKEQGWSLKVAARGSCPFQVQAQKANCWQWNQNVLNDLLTDPPDAVFVEGTEVSAVGSEPESIDANRIAAWQQLAARGVKVLVLRAGPRFIESQPKCLMRTEQIATCGISAATLYAKRSPMKDAGIGSAQIREVDLTGAFCPQGRCEPVIGNVIVYRDRRHFTATFARTMSGFLQDALTAVAPELIRPGNTPAR